MVPVGELQHPHQAWHADRAAADDSSYKPQRLPRGVHESIGPGVGGRRLAPIVGMYLAGERIVMDQKSAAADSGRLWLDERKHRLRGNRCIDCAATGIKHRIRRLACERVRGNRKEVTRARHRLGLPAACTLGLRSAGGLDHGRREG
jgi:hypothetical protein